MSKSWDDVMEIGLVHFMAFPQTIKGDGPILETVKEIVDDDFFKAIEVTWIKDEKVRIQVRDLLSSSGMAIGFGAQPPLLLNKLDLNAFDNDRRQEATAQVKASVDEALFMRARGIAVLSGPDPGQEKREAARGLLVDSLNEICSYAAERGDISVILETFDRGIGKNCLIGPTEEAVLVAEELRKDYSNFGLMLDLSHLPLLGESASHALGAAGDYLAHVHMGNCVMRDENHPAYGDEHPCFGIAEGENGVEELREFLSVLFNTGFFDKRVKPIVSFEVKPHGEETSKGVIGNAKETFRKAWELLLK